MQRYYQNAIYGDIKGKSVRDTFGSRRRLDFVVVEDGKVKGVYEVNKSDSR